MYFILVVPYNFITLLYRKFNYELFSDRGPYFDLTDFFVYSLYFSPSWDILFFCKVVQLYQHIFISLFCPPFFSINAIPQTVNTSNCHLFVLIFFKCSFMVIIKFGKYRDFQYLISTTHFFND